MQSASLQAREKVINCRLFGGSVESTFIAGVVIWSLNYCEIATELILDTTNFDVNKINHLQKSDRKPVHIWSKDLVV